MNTIPRRLTAVYPALLALLALLAGPAQMARAQHGDTPPATPPGQAQPPAEAAPDTAKEDEKPREIRDWEKPLIVTEHDLDLPGGKLHYTATAGRMQLTSYEGKPKADLFFVAYTKRPNPSGDGTKPAPIDLSTRPIVFAFNGGPGSSSVWLHMGALGPKRVPMDPEGWTLPPPYKLVDNEATWLDVADLVFIDPVSTGFSRAVEGEAPGQFHGLDEDMRAVGDFIRLYTTRYERWGSPKFLAGESYGTTRAAALSGYLQDSCGMYLNGIVLVSAVLNFGTIRFDSGNDLPYWLYLPTYTASAWYHGKLGADLQGGDLEAAIRQAEAYASGEYVQILAKGSTLSDAERLKAAKDLARLTGLSEQYILRTNLRINISNFCKELLRDRGQMVGRFDSRFKGLDSSGIGSSPDFDPSYSAILGPYAATFNDYVRKDLKFESDLPYEILTGRVQPWSYASSNNRYVNVAETLRAAIVKNPSLRVLLMSGVYDLATPFYASDYTMSHLGLPPQYASRIESKRYLAGHMMYLRHADLLACKKDAAAFITAPTPAVGQPAENREMP